MALGNPGKHYPRAPITEAVIEYRFEEDLPAGTVAKAVQRVRTNYENVRQVFNVGELRMEVAADGARGQAKLEPVQRITSSTEAEIVLISPKAFTVAQLAPYSTWEDFFGRFARDWEEFKRAARYQKIARVGVRFINRIDIPYRSGELLHIENYLKFNIDTPSELGPMGYFAAQALFKVDEIGGQIRINSASVPPALVDHLSLLLDIDVSKEEDLPHHDEALYELLSKFRTAKNRAFESCLTDSARELFGYERNS